MNKKLVEKNEKPVKKKSNKKLRVYNKVIASRNRKKQCGGVQLM